MPALAPTLTSAPCPCQNAGDASTPAYAACCGRFHAVAMYGLAPSAETLMRSRYSAFVLDLTDYLLATWHVNTRPAALESNPVGLKWLGLQVKATRSPDADHASVEFVARSKLGGRAQRLHEISQFVRSDGRWFYVDGIQR